MIKIGIKTEFSVSSNNRNRNWNQKKLKENGFGAVCPLYIINYDII